MSISAATSFAQTVFSYFSPTKSPYYSVIAFATTSLVISAPISYNWFIVYFPIVLLLAYSTLLSVFDQPVFEEKEYDDQIKFSRAFSLSTAVICLVFMALEIESNVEDKSNSWNFWVGYFACLIQLIIFAFYAYVYANLQAKPIYRNFVQLALITSTYLIGLTYANTLYAEVDIDSESYGHYYYTFLTLSFLWAATILIWLHHLKRSIVFQVLVPDDVQNDR